MWLPSEICEPGKLTFLFELSSLFDSCRKAIVHVTQHCYNLTMWRTYLLCRSCSAQGHSTVTRASDNERNLFFQFPNAINQLNKFIWVCMYEYLLNSFAAVCRGWKLKDLMRDLLDNPCATTQNILVAKGQKYFCWNRPKAETLMSWPGCLTL